MKKIDVWVLSIEDSGDPAESRVYNSHEEAVGGLREFFLELAKGAYRVEQDYDDLKSLVSPEQVNDVARVVDQITERHARMLMTVENLLPSPGAEINAEVLWDNRVVWLEKHTLTLAARTEWVPGGTR